MRSFEYFMATPSTLDDALRDCSKEEVLAYNMDEINAFIQVLKEQKKFIKQYVRDSKIQS